MAVSSVPSTNSGTSDGDETTDPTEAAAVWPPMPDAPGRLLDVEGHLMHLYCIGEGAPTVLLEAGLGDYSLLYRPLQDELAATSTRVCSYDRSGLGWSEPGPLPRTGRQITGELTTLLQTADEQGPFVLVGHSLGGLLVLMYAEAYPQDVAGVLLLDSTHPEATEVFAANLPEVLALQDEQLTWVEDVAQRLETGETTAVDLLPLAPDLPLDLQYQWGALAARPHTFQTVAAEMRGLEETMGQVGRPGSLGDIPLVVVAAGASLNDRLSEQDLDNMNMTRRDIDRQDVLSRGLQEDLVTWSSNATLVIAHESAHYVYFDEPQVVLKAIRELREQK